MIELPRDLAPWRPLLSIFAPDLAESLGSMLPRLALAVGPMRASRPAGDGDPDGFSGLARRGSYERLLLTEWLLADEAPDEFIRRAASGEHAFLQLVRRSPACARVSVALFDAGPDQLGAPRIAHLAALVALAARAERAGARFAWGILHRPEGPIYEGLTKETVAPLLAARSALGATDEDLTAWERRATSSGWEDAWIVGAQTIVPGWKHSTLAVTDVLDPDRRVLTAVARAPGATPREVELPLPDDRACARLLRDPFVTVAPAPAVRRREGAPIASNLVFATNGTKVFARAENGEILAYPVPNTSNDPAGRVKRYAPRAGGWVAAVGWIARGLVMLTIMEREIRIEHTTNAGPALLRSAIPIPEGMTFARPTRFDTLAPLAYWPGDPEEVYFTDAARRLFVVACAKGAAARVRAVAGEVSLFALAGNRAAYVAQRLTDIEDDIVQAGVGGALRAADGRFHVVVQAWSASSFGGALSGDGTFEAVAGCAAIKEGTSPLVAVQNRGDRWTVFERSRPAGDLRADDSERIVGITRKPEGTPRLVAVEPDQRTLALVGDGSSARIHRASAPIADVAVCTRRPQLAYVTTAGEVVIVSLADHTVRARFLA